MRGGDRRRQHCAVVAGAVRRGDGVRVRVRATAVDETRRGQRRAGPDGGALRAQVRPGGRGVAGAALGLVRRAAAAAERACAREGGGRAGQAGGPCDVRAAEQEGQHGRAAHGSREGGGIERAG